MSLRDCIGNSGQNSRASKSHHRRRLVARALCLCSAAFVSVQLLLAHSGLSGGGGGGGSGRGGGDSRHQRFLLLLRGASSQTGQGKLPRVEAAGQRHHRVVECLRALDAELRLLAVQPILTVEAFQSRFLAERAAADQAAANDAVERLPPCPTTVPDSHWDEAVDGSDPWNRSPDRGKAAPSQPGGRHRPSDCQPSSCVLLLIPYRNRRRHLRILLRHLHPVMQAQRLCYTVVVAEQFGNATFNKAKLMNAAFLESVKLGHFDCVIFHDVDLIPTNQRIPYACPSYPRHNSVSIDKFGYSLPYKQLIGGVLAMPVRHFLRVNGYSNLFWGWGGEDDDMETRIRTVGLLVTRPHPGLARYRMIRHGARKEILGEVRYKLLHLSSKRYRLDGLNSLNYSVVSLTLLPLYTRILIDIGEPPPSSKYY